MVTYIKRDKSFLTGRKTLEPLYSLKNFPVFIGCTDQKKEKDLRADMEFSICSETGIVQLSRLLPPELVYSEYHSEAVGGVWKEHFEKFAQFILEQNPHSILEIGGGNGQLASLLLEKSSTIKATVIEPTPGPNLLALKNKYGAKRLKIMAAFFGKNLKLKGTEDIDAIVHSHVLEHAYDPLEFLESIHRLLKIGGKHIFVVPNLYVYLENNQPNALNFEHTYMITEVITDYWMEKFGFKILKKQHFKNHGVFYACVKMNDGNNPKPPQEYAKYKKIYLNFIENNKRMVASFNKKIEEFDGEIYMFGAHIFSQFLVYLGLDASRIKSVLDNSEAKQGKRLYGTGLYVESPEAIRHKRKVAVILKVGAYREEVSEQLKKINPNVIFWE